MRIPCGGTRDGQTDPNIIPRSAVQWVEVLADGASSVYSSDAVAGVVHYITRSSFSGAEVAGKVGFADNWYTYDVNGVVVTNRNTDGIYVDDQKTDRISLRIKDRDFLSRSNLR